MTGDHARIVSQRVEVQAAAIYARISADMDRLNCRRSDAHDTELSKLNELVRRSEMRIAALGEHIDKSRFELATTSAQYNDIARKLPGDIATLSDQLTSILSSAGTEADRIRSDAHERAAEIIADAQREHDEISAKRAELELQSAELHDEIARLRDQAIRDSAGIIRDAEDAAEQLLSQVRIEMAAQQQAAQAKLADLVAVREMIAEQLRDFYAKFTELEHNAEPFGPFSPIAVSAIRGHDEGEVDVVA